MSNELKPGPELDALVAEKVMGEEPSANFNPSRTIEHAWEVVEKLKQDGYDLNIGWKHGKWKFVVHDDRNGKTYDSTLPELPVAICRAALMTVTKGENE